MHKYDDIISMENLLEVWKEFKRGKNKRKDVISFQSNLFENIRSLHCDLKNKTYLHGGYIAFDISDPKPRDIHKASVRDRLLHHAIYRIMYSHFDERFIFDSYSCRLRKGTFMAIERFEYFCGKVSKNNTRICWVLKCDIRKFFASIDQEILIKILEERVLNKDILQFFEKVIKSFELGVRGKGLPLGNLTSQLLVNIYMDKFDHFVKEGLKEKYYIRYADDFVFMSDDKSHLENLIPKISEFLENNLKLSLHPDKLFIKTLYSGIDFLGWVHFSKHKVLRTTTKKRMFRNIIIKKSKKETLQSYLGLLKHGNAIKLELKIQKQGYG
jgi:RNA-directed DNA polymerase